MNRITLNIKFMSGSQLSTFVKPNDMISTIKDTIEKNQGIPTEHQILIYKGKRLEDMKTVSGYGLATEDVVYFAFDSAGRHRWDY